MMKQMTIKACRIQVGDTFVKSVEVGFEGTTAPFIVKTITDCTYSEYMITLNDTVTVHRDELIIVKR